MRHPIWLVNALLALLVLIAAMFVFFSTPNIPRKARLYPETDIRPERSPIKVVDVEKIYNNDLFGTYQTTHFPVDKPEYGSPMPQPPQPKAVKVPLAQPPKFLPPLAITLNGILFVSNEDENTAIIKDNKTSGSKNYRIGEKVGDAQIIRIMHNKIILIRSNGQQETLYVSKFDAEQDQEWHGKKNWDVLAQRKTANKFLIDPIEFSIYVADLAQLIDILNLTTVYDKGQSIGCRIGIIPQDSLGSTLGLSTGDIITKINGIPTTDTASRLKIYEEVITKKSGDTISVEIMNKQGAHTIDYSLINLTGRQPDQNPEQATQPGSLTKVGDEKIKLLKEQKKIAPTLHDLRTKERARLLKHGKKNDRRNKNILLNMVK